MRNAHRVLLACFVAASTLLVFASSASAAPRVSIGLTWGSPAPTVVAPRRHRRVKRVRHRRARPVVVHHRAGRRVVHRPSRPAVRKVVVVERTVRRPARRRR